MALGSSTSADDNSHSSHIRKSDVSGEHSPGTSCRGNVVKTSPIGYACRRRDRICHQEPEQRKVWCCGRKLSRRTVLQSGPSIMEKDELNTKGYEQCHLGVLCRLLRTTRRLCQHIVYSSLHVNEVPRCSKRGPLQRGSYVITTEIERKEQGVRHRCYRTDWSFQD